MKSCESQRLSWYQGTALKCVYIFLKAYTSTFSQLLGNVFVKTGIVSFCCENQNSILKNTLFPWFRMDSVAVGLGHILHTGNAPGLRLCLVGCQPSSATGRGVSLCWVCQQPQGGTETDSSVDICDICVDICRVS